MLIINDNEIRFSNQKIVYKSEIPVGNWLVKWDDLKYEYYLVKMDDFILPKKIYGNPEKLVNRYLNTFNTTKGNLGIVLSGLKGTGKSLTAKQVCIKSKLPVITITEPYHGAEFNDFIGSISQKCVVFVDEFEKVYDKQEKQQSLLSLLDGVFMGEKLFLFTSNEISNYSNYLLNRPGRIHYLKKYDRLDESLMDDILSDLLDNQEYAEGIKGLIGYLEEANVDMLLALIKECNMYGEEPNDAIKYLNIQSSKSRYSILVTDKDGLEYEGDEYLDPLNGGRRYLECELTLQSKRKLTKEQLEETEGWITFNFLPSRTKPEIDGRVITIKNYNNTYDIKFTPASALSRVPYEI